MVELMPGKADLRLIDLAGDSFGLMVLEGLLLVELEAGRAHIGWMVGSGDLIRPSGMRQLALTDRHSWRALKDSRLAVLDRQFVLRAGGIPMVSRVLVNRATRTANWLLAKSLIASSPLIEERVLLMFALFGERWGKVTPEGVAITLPLTHSNLAALCGARRPSVTIALRALQRDGLLSCTAKGTWLLRRLHSQDDSRPPRLADYERSLGLSLADLAPERRRRPGLHDRPMSGHVSA
jgi:CRP-like cAMP-binding protein